MYLYDDECRVFMERIYEDIYCGRHVPILCFQQSGVVMFSEIYGVFVNDVTKCV